MARLHYGSCIVQSVCLCDGREVDERVCDVEGLGTCLFYKYSQQLFKKYTNNASEGVVHKCEFVDDVALLVTNRTAAEEAQRLYSGVASEFGLTVSTSR